MNASLIKNKSKLLPLNYSIKKKMLPFYQNIYSFQSDSDLDFIIKERDQLRNEAKKYKIYLPSKPRYIFILYYRKLSTSFSVSSLRKITNNLDQYSKFENSSVDSKEKLNQNFNDLMFKIREQKKIMYSIAEFLLDNSNKYSLDYNMFFKIRTALDSDKKVYNDITDLLPQHNHNVSKDIYKLLHMNLYKLMNDPKVSLESFADKSLIDKLIKQSHFLLVNEDISNSEFSKEILNFLPQEELNKFQKIVEDTNNYLKTKENLEYLNKLDKNIILTKLIFYELLSEISVENKERAELLYHLYNKIFSIQIQCLLAVEERMEKRIEVYKKLTDFILEKYRKKDDETTDMKEIGKILINSTLSIDNLLKHKEVIQNLLNEIK